LKLDAPLIASQNNPPNTLTSSWTILLIALIIGVVFLLCLCYFLRARENEVEEEDFEKESHNYESSLEIREHMNFMLKILNDIKRTTTKTLKINFCMMCMADYVPYTDTLNTTVRRFNCGHLFHHQCISDFNECLLCKGRGHQVGSNYSAYNSPIPNNVDYKNNSIPTTPQYNTPNNTWGYGTQNNNMVTGNSSYNGYTNPNNTNFCQNNDDLFYLITEMQVINFIENFKEIYEEDELRQYSRENPKDVQHLQQSEQGFSMWGLAAGVAVGGLVGYGLGSYMNSHNQTAHTNNFNHQNNYETQDDYNGDAVEEGW